MISWLFTPHIHQDVSGIVLLNFIHFWTKSKSKHYNEINLPKQFFVIEIYYALKNNPTNHIKSWRIWRGGWHKANVSVGPSFLVVSRILAEMSNVCACVNSRISSCVWKFWRNKICFKLHLSFVWLTQFLITSFPT